MIAALPSFAEPINMDSDTKVWRDAAIRTASSMSDAYWSNLLGQYGYWGWPDIDGVSEFGGIEGDREPFGVLR